MTDTAIKMVGEDRIGGYLVVWGDAEHTDLQGEYFTPNTDLALDWYAKRPALYHHGLDGTMKATPVGVIDTATPDAVGLWAEGQLDIRNRYVDAVRKLVKRGALAWSSGSIPHLVEVADDGEIKRWPIVEGSMTPSPAEPRNTGISPIKHVCDAVEIEAAYKSAGIDFPASLLADGGNEAADATEQAAVDGTSAPTIRIVGKATPIIRIVRK